MITSDWSTCSRSIRDLSFVLSNKGGSFSVHWTPNISIKSLTLEPTCPYPIIPTFISGKEKWEVLFLVISIKLFNTYSATERALLPGAYEKNIFDSLR